ncbi:uncharacterized protein LOC132258092 [Phlebotomus argentipes]|uniref:uncharacterized protein LOC132258092 n=1 Tax=Phlebotomus argentipes TaxID=94469 RepID=UPI00289298FB|nr:uncharacterized protein LOC132258092 [Phlebotomus argentipes]
MIAAKAAKKKMEKMLNNNSLATSNKKKAAENDDSLFENVERRFHELAFSGPKSSVKSSDSAFELLLPTTSILEQKNFPSVTVSAAGATGAIAKKSQTSEDKSGHGIEALSVRSPKKTTTNASTAPKAKASGVQQANGEQKVTPEEYAMLRARVDMLESFIGALAADHSDLRCQVALCMGYRTNIQALEYRLNVMSGGNAKKEAKAPPQNLPVAVPKAAAKPPKPPRRAQSTEVLPSAGPASDKYQHLFVTRLANSVTTDQVADYMESKLTSKRRPRCIPLNRPDDPRDYSSFRVELLPGDFKEASGAGFWSEGIIATTFKFKGAPGHAKKRSTSTHSTKNF